MNKEIRIKVAIVVAMVIAQIDIVSTAMAQSVTDSPYAMFGDNSAMLDARKEIPNDIYRVQFLANNGVTYLADFDLNKGIATLKDLNGSIILQDSISENAKAMFTTMDPDAEKFYNISPYAYCMGNPVRFVDPDGKRPKAYEAALMAACVYGGDNSIYMEQLKESGWTVSQFQTSIQKNYTNFNQNGLQSELFQRTIDGVTEYAYVYAGTNSLEDAVEDIAQLAGISPQYNTAIHNAKTLSGELGNNELTFVGHSLGGGEAIASSMATGRAAITFNSAAVSGLTKLTGKLDATPNVVNYRAIGKNIGWGIRIGGDMLNNVQEKVGLKLPGKTIDVPTGLIPTHTIYDFLKCKLPEP